MYPRVRSFQPTSIEWIKHYSVKLRVFLSFSERAPTRLEVLCFLQLTSPSTRCRQCAAVAPAASKLARFMRRCLLLWNYQSILSKNGLNNSLWVGLACCYKIAITCPRDVWQINYVPTGLRPVFHYVVFTSSHAWLEQVTRIHTRLHFPLSTNKSRDCLLGCTANPWSAWRQRDHMNSRFWCVWNRQIRCSIESTADRSIVGRRGLFTTGRKSSLTCALVYNIW